MKKILFALLAVLLIFTGCEAEPACTSEFVPQSGIYRAEKKPDAILNPILNIDLENNTFSFSYDPASSYLPYGTIKRLENGYLLQCTTNDNKFTYKFRITSADTLVFIAETAEDEIVVNGVALITDGTEFKLYK